MLRECILHGKIDADLNWKRNTVANTRFAHNHRLQRLISMRSLCYFGGQMVTMGHYVLNNRRLHSLQGFVCLSPHVSSCVYTCWAHRCSSSETISVTMNVSGQHRGVSLCQMFEREKERMSDRKHYSDACESCKYVIQLRDSHFHETLIESGVQKQIC